MLATIDRFRGCLLGLAAGDAVGTTVEFKPRGTFPPVTDMTGGGPFNLQKGQWTDDTSMALCLAASLLETGQFDPADQMRRYVDWWQNGYMSSNGRCFDIGNTVRQALWQFQQSGEPYSGSTDPHSAGNGSIMRLAPVPMFYYPNIEQATHYSAESSRTTHGAVESVEASRLFGRILHKALSGEAKEAILFDHNPADYAAPAIQAIAQGEYRQKSDTQIYGSGYVVHSLEAALYCFDKTDSFETAVLQATNLGDDADTTAAICGQVAGAFYGESGIPLKWLTSLTMRHEIGKIAEELMRK